MDKNNSRKSCYSQDGEPIPEAGGWDSFEGHPVGKLLALLLAVFLTEKLNTKSAEEKSLAPYAGLDYKEPK